MSLQLQQSCPYQGPELLPELTSVWPTGARRAVGPLLSGLHRERRTRSGRFSGSAPTRSGCGWTRGGRGPTGRSARELRPCSRPETTTRHRPDPGERRPPAPKPSIKRRTSGGWQSCGFFRLVSLNLTDPSGFRWRQRWAFESGWPRCLRFRKSILQTRNRIS